LRAAAAQRGKPLCASAILYLNEEWPPEFDAETLFLDPGTGTGALVRERAPCINRVCE
jgi:hypothetical protein